MKKFALLISLSVMTFCFFQAQTNAQTDFIKAISTCEKYSQQGSVTSNGETFDILITLNKGKGTDCIYKEKIYQGKEHQTLNCTFNKHQTDYIANSMTEFTKMFSKQISKNKIFEAKLTNNGEIFQKYLVNHKYCNITYSKK